MIISTSFCNVIYNYVDKFKDYESILLQVSTFSIFLSQNIFLWVHLRICRDLRDSEMYFDLCYVICQSYAKVETKQTKTWITQRNTRAWIMAVRYAPGWGTERLKKCRMLLERLKLACCDELAGTPSLFLPSGWCRSLCYWLLPQGYSAHAPMRESRARRAISSDTASFYRET